MRGVGEAEGENLVENLKDELLSGTVYLALI
jgi:hypothetical protein